MDELITLNMIEAFVEVARKGSVTQAARSLGRSQPAVSHRLKALEEQLGAPVLEKIGRSVQLTPQGEILLSECEAVLAKLRGLPGLLMHEGVNGGEVVVGTFATLARYMLIDSVVWATQEMPRVKWSVRIGVSAGLFDELRQGVTDVLYLVGDYEVDPQIQVEVLGEVRAAVIISGELWPHEHAPTSTDLREMRLLLWRGMRDPSFELVEAHAQSLGLIGGSTFEVPQIEMLRELAIRGVGYTLLPGYVAREDARQGRLRIFGLEGMDRSFPIKQYTLKQRKLALATRQFMEHVQRAVI